MGYLCVLSSKQYAQLNPQKHLIFGHSIFFFRIFFVVIGPVHISLFLNKVCGNEFRNSVIKHHHHLFSIEHIFRNALEPVESLIALVLHFYNTRQKVLDKTQGLGHRTLKSSPSYRIHTVCSWCVPCEFRSDFMITVYWVVYEHETILRVTLIEHVPCVS